MAVVTRLKRKRYTRPERCFSGLFLFLAAAVSGFDDADRLTSHLYEAAFIKPQRFNAPVADSESVCRTLFSIDYYDLFHQRITYHNGTQTETAAQSPQFTTAWQYATASWAAQIEVNSNAFFIHHRDSDDGIECGVRQSVRTLGCSLWKHSTPLSVGAHVGAAFGNHMHAPRDPAEFIPYQPAHLIRHCPTINFGLSSNLSLGPFSIDLTGYRHVYHASTPYMTHLSSDVQRTFPLGLTNRTASATARYSHPNALFELAFTREHMEERGFVDAENSLPNDLQFLLRTVRAHSRFTTGSTRTRLLAWYRFGGGYLAGYSNAFNYLVADSAALLNAGGIARISFSKRLNAGLFGEWGDAAIPSASLHTAPFSMWTIFDPRKYRFRDMTFRGYEGGVFINTSCALGKRNHLTPELSVSRFKARMRVLRDERELFVWIPVYVNDTTLTPIELRGHMACAALTYSVSLRRFALDISLRQRIPFVEDRGGATEGGQTSAPADSPVKKQYGGTEYHLRITYGD